MSVLKYISVNLSVSIVILLTQSACVSQSYKSENENTATTPNLLNQQPDTIQQPDTKVMPVGSETTSGSEKQVVAAKQVVKQPKELAAEKVITAATEFSDFGDSTNLEEKSDGDFYVTVGSTDTISDIAEKFTGKVGNWQELARLNNLGSRGIVKAGQKIRIPNFMKEIGIATIEETDSSLPIAKTVLVK